MPGLKILGISPFVWTMGEGKGIPSLYRVQKAFVNAGHEVHLVIPHGDPFVPGRTNIAASEEGFNVYQFWLPLKACWWLAKLHRFAESRSRLAGTILGNFHILFIYILFCSIGLLKSLRLARRVKPDVVYSHTFHFALVAYLVAKACKVPNVSRFYGVGDYQYALGLKRGRRFPLFPNYELQAFKIPAGLMVITNDGTRGDKVAEKAGVPPEKIRFWVNGVDKDMYQPDFNREAFMRSMGLDPDTKVILAASRLEGWKRVDRLIEAMPAVCSGNREVVCLIVGDGSQRKSLEELSRSLKVDSQARFMGAVSHQRMSDFMNSADVFVSLFDLSNVSNSLLEAMVCGRCIITLNVGGTGDIIRNFENGVILEVEELERLPRFMNMLLNDTELREKLGRKAREHAMAHLPTWEERGEMEVEAIEKLCSDGTSKAPSSRH